MGWQPIETAPREGRVDLWVKYYWGDKTYQCRVADAFWWDTRGHWEWIGRGPNDEPTHWMPIPEPPQ